MSAHTPGPWRVIGGGLHIASDNAPGHVIVCRTGRLGMVGDEPKQTLARWEADAHLIAAAPDLLEALEAYHFHFGILEENEFINAEARRCASLARAAIAKAKGETQ